MTAARGAVGASGPGTATSPMPYGGVAVPLLAAQARTPRAAAAPDRTMRFRAMACDVTMRVVAPTASAGSALDRAREVFERVERTCTRFDPDSPLMRANAEPDAWHQVPVELFDAVAAAAAAYRETGGLFDPRVLRVLESLGYDRTLPFARGPVRTPAATVPVQVPAHEDWRPGLGRDGRSVWLGPDPVDLGGIGKGLAVRWAAECLMGAGQSVLVEAGGDCSASGAGPEGDGWKVGVENPLTGDDPVAVLSVSNMACATSSVRVRRWRSGGAQVHHLIDPRTGRPGAGGLAAVTVVGTDPARAEVWAKSLFLTGANGVLDLAKARGLAALWVRDDGTVASSSAMDSLVVWRADGAC